MRQGEVLGLVGSHFGTDAPKTEACHPLHWSPFAKVRFKITEEISSGFPERLILLNFII